MDLGGPIFFCERASLGKGRKNVETTGKEQATLAGGCFWCLEAVFEQLRGVEKVVSGYAGGQTPDPTYPQVCGGRTGHAEVVQVTFDPAVVSFREVLEVFFGTHDPTTLNRQGPDVGTQYRSAVFYHTPQQKQTAEQLIRELNAATIWDAPIVTEVTPLAKFYPAEEYHQGYYRGNPGQGYCMAVVGPKVAKFRKQFASKLKA
jgi:peptide-methionine (S)-S-oxide reductase